MFNLLETLVKDMSRQGALQNSSTEQKIAYTMEIQENYQMDIQSVIATGTRE